MSDHLRLRTYRWVVAILALVMALSVGAGANGAVTNASTVNTTGAVQSTTAKGAGPGIDPAQIAVQNEAPSVTCPNGQCFADVGPGSTFFTFVNNIYGQGLVAGYACGGSGEPCDAANRPYYRAAAQVSRGQMSKFVDNARNLAGINIQSGLTPISSVSDQPNGAGIQGFGTVQDSTGVLGSGTAAGPGRTIFDLNTGGYFSGSGSNNSVGAVLYGAQDNGVWIQTDKSTSYGAYVVNAKGGIAVGDVGDNPRNNVFIGGPLTVNGGCTGCTLLTIMQNTGDSELHPGEVASMSSAVTGPAMVGDQPLVGVSVAQGAYDSAVVGVVAHRWVPADPNAPVGTILNTGYYDYSATAIKPGEYMGVATTGAYKEVQVSAENGPIHVGDLLVTGNTAGVAMKATDKLQAVGATLGKAMGNLETGTGVVPVLLTLK